MTSQVIQGALLISLLVGPIAIATMVVGVGMHGFQGGWVFAPNALQFNWSRLNPANGVKRLGLMQSGMRDPQDARSRSRSSPTWRGAIVGSFVIEAPQLAWLTPFGAAMLAWSHAETLLWRVAWALGVLALGDYALQKYRLTSSLKMTKQEVKDEHKMMEGSPENKHRVRKAQVAIARRRMMQDVARATVVITNPTHFAVALEYRRDRMAAPMVLAKGADHVALRIRDVARVSRRAHHREQAARAGAVPHRRNRPDHSGTALRRRRGSPRLPGPDQTTDALIWRPHPRPIVPVT